MHIYKYLYVPEGLQKKKENLIKKLKNGKLLPGVYLITRQIRTSWIFSRHVSAGRKIIRRSCRLSWVLQKILRMRWK